MSAVTLKTILDIGGKHNLTGEICGYVQEAQLSRVNRAFRAGNVETMARVGRCIALEDRASIQTASREARQLCSEEERGNTLERLFTEADGAIEASPVWPLGKDELRVGLNRLREVYEKNRQRSEASGEQCADRLIPLLNGMKQSLAEFPGAHDGPRTPEQEEALNQLFNRGLKFLVRENLATRFHDVHREFSTLHASQKEGATFSAVQRQRFEELDRSSFALERFRAAEELVFNTEIDRDRALEQAWRQIRQCINVGPHVNARAPLVRAWMIDPANQNALEGVYALDLGRINVCPPEIGRLSSLRWLRLVNGALTSLPREFENLRSLGMLDLSNQRFAAMPDLAYRLPSLMVISLTGNPEFRSVSEEFTRHFFGWNALLGEAIGDALRFLELVDGSNSAFRNCRLFSADEQLTEIPFCLWFRDTFSIPHFPLMPVIPLAVGGIALIGLLTPYLDWFGSIIALILAGIIALPFLALCLALILLDLPIFLWNAFVGMTLEPLVTQVRDYWDYSHMVRLHEDAAGVATPA